MITVKVKIKNLEPKSLYPAQKICGETRVGQSRCTPYRRFAGRREGAKTKAKSLFSFFLVSPQRFSAGFSGFGCDFSSLKSESHFTPHRKFAGRRGWVNATVPRTGTLRGDESRSKPLHPALEICGETRRGENIG